MPIRTQTLAFLVLLGLVLGTCTWHGRSRHDDDGRGRARQHRR